jgi:hypothetical protein
MSASHAHTDIPHRPIVRTMRLLSTKPWPMMALGHSAADSVEELKKRKAFDLSNDPTTPLAIWYNGMGEACRNPDKVLEQVGKP